MTAADGIKNGVNPLAREAVNLFHEVMMLVVNWDAAQIGNGQAPEDAQVPYISNPATRPSCKSAEPTHPRRRGSTRVDPV